MNLNSNLNNGPDLAFLFLDPTFPPELDPSDPENYELLTAEVESGLALATVAA
ncbi:MAG: hypothetical protein O3A19_05495 [Planctomycetota bacterium]|nr:hypothetical protein [Planctomycetota bacterium]MDA1025864.1 hypothetical protein [Planctomycetota bacterium]